VACCKRISVSPLWPYLKTVRSEVRGFASTVNHQIIISRRADRVLKVPYSTMSSKKDKREEKKREARAVASEVVLSDRAASIIEIRRIMKEREKARENSDFAKSDHLREKLETGFGVIVKDQVNGPSGWKFKDGSSRTLPPGTAVPLDATKKRRRDDEQEGGQAKAEISSGSSSTNAKVAKTSSSNAQTVQQSKKDGLGKAVTGNGKPSTISTESARNKNILAAVTNVQTSSKQRNVQGVLVEDVLVGQGNEAVSGKRIKVQYVGRLKSNNKVFDASKKPFAFTLGRSEVIKGWDIGVAGMKIGGKRILTIPPEKAYGKTGAPPTIPPNATLVFEVTLLQ
jgi:FKBP-type peptidyl-prolyl cis-trans isomerase